MPSQKGPRRGRSRHISSRSAYAPQDGLSIASLRPWKALENPWTGLRCRSSHDHARRKAARAATLRQKLWPKRGDGPASADPASLLPGERLLAGRRESGEKSWPKPSLSPALVRFWRPHPFGLTRFAARSRIASRIRQLSNVSRVSRPDSGGAGLLIPVNYTGRGAKAGELLRRRAG